jgi:hypothetical protein
MYPAGREFAFTLLDDTDDMSLSKGRPVYALLQQHGLRTTKTVWARSVPPAERGIYHAGETLQDPGQLEWIRALEQAGFEIAFHNAAMASSTRAQTMAALAALDASLARPVRLHCNHGQNQENLYWGHRRYRSGPVALLAWLAAGRRGRQVFQGEQPGSPFYWADIAEQRMHYLRNLSFSRLGGRSIPPGRPYREPRKLQRPVFFNTADAPDAEAFCRLVTPAAIEQLRRTGGWAIVSTHLGKGFHTPRGIHPGFRRIIEHLGQQPGWYVPVSTLLDHLCQQQGSAPLGRWQRLAMELAHGWDRLVTGRRAAAARRLARAGRR